jgi:metallophosphoesterase superfamily enzyme
MIEGRLADADEEHKAAISDAHSDYGKDFGKKDIIDWVETLSPSRKKAYKEIIENGDTEEVIDLIGNFKEAKGIKTEKPKENEDEEVEDTKSKKLNEMEVVKGKRTPVGTGLKKADDFESAFDEATSK